MTIAHLLTLLHAVLVAMGVPASVTLPDTHPTMVRMRECAADVVAVTDLLPVEKRATYAPIVFVFANLEGGCYASPAGSNDNGAACGVMQIHEPQKIIAGATCEKVRADRRLGIRVGVAAFTWWEHECGSLADGLSGYATGHCPPKGKPIPLVRKRCALAGGVC
jgi:hypothetical protein